jgi:transcriptional regulator with XRE-family HTH domain
MGVNIGVPILKVNRNSDSFLYQNSDMSIGARVREARKAAKLTQQQLAAKVGIQQSTLSELENGESAGTGYVATMAAVLGVSALWLETGKGPQKLDSQPLPDSGPIIDSLIAGTVLPTEEVLELVSLYAKSNTTWRKKIMDLARIGGGRPGQGDPEETNGNDLR